MKITADTVNEVLEQLCELSQSSELPYLRAYLQVKGKNQLGLVIDNPDCWYLTYPIALETGLSRAEIRQFLTDEIERHQLQVMDGAQLSD